MPDAFLHKSSLLDKFHKEAGFKNPITQARTARSWENPITRNKREKGITAWANSFAGKAHYRKLARFNAMRSESMDTPLSKICDVLNRVAAGRSLPYKADMLEGANAPHIALHGDNKYLDISYNGNGDLEVYTAKNFVGKPSHVFTHWDSVDEIAERLIGLIATLKKGESHMASRWEDFQGFLNNVSDRLVGMYDVDPVLVQDYFDTHHSELQDAESSADSFKEKVYAVYKDLAAWAGFEVQEAKDESLRYILRESRLKKFRSEDRRGTDRYGHRVKRFTDKDLTDPDPDKFGLAYLDSTSINAYSNNFQNKDAFLHALSTKPVTRTGVNQALSEEPINKWPRDYVTIYDFFPENGICYLGRIVNGKKLKELVIKWGPALKKESNEGNETPDSDGFVYIKPDPKYNRAEWGNRGCDFGSFTSQLHKKGDTYTGLVYVQGALREFSTDGKTGYFRDAKHQIPTDNVDYAALWKECQRIFRMNKSWMGLQTEGNETGWSQVKAAATAAWSASNAKDFKLDITSTPEEVKIHAKSPDGEDNIGVYWKVKRASKDSQDTPLTIEQYTTWPSDSNDPERTWDVADYDALENSFTDEFASLQETLDISKT